tara:strand:- start:25 stop:966 length:942 start_codon:yes stop_codon:yes gene_type:complete
MLVSKTAKDVEQEDLDSLFQKLSAKLETLKMTPDDKRIALKGFMNDTHSHSFTAGCTTTMMGIGASTQMSSDMLLTHALVLEGPGGMMTTPRGCDASPPAEIMTTTDMPTPHIITIDWLRQVGPCVIEPFLGRLRTSLPVAEVLRMTQSFCKLKTTMSGGAFVAQVSVGGEEMALTVDTGAGVTIALSSQAARRVRDCSRQRAQKAIQHGVTGETVCSDVVRCPVAFGDHKLRDCPVFFNDSEVEDADGYVGAGLLKQYDILILHDALYVKKNGDASDLFVDDVTRGGECKGGLATRCGTRSIPSRTVTPITP